MSYIALATTTLGSAASSVTFSSIPTSVSGVALRDLVLVIAANYTSGDGNVQLRLNGDTGANYTNIYMLGGGSGSGVSGAVTQPWIYGGGMNTSQGNGQIFQLMDFSATNKHKTVLNRTSEVGGAVYAWAGRWASTSAVNTIRIVGQDGGRSFAIGSTFSLYGIAG